MFLADVDIEKGVVSGDIVIEGFDRKRLQPASYDIRLGTKFIFNNDYLTGFIDPVKKVFSAKSEVSIEKGKTFILHPGVSVLATSEDFFGSNKYLIQLSGKSSLARIGLIVHNTAGLINPGHFLNITLELYNLNSIPIILRPGMEIAQLLFAELSCPPKHSYPDQGRYHKDNWQGYVPPKKSPQPSKQKKK
jgi:dCTP deaminase